MSDVELPSDGAMAASFADYLSHREVLGILDKYRMGYKVTLNRRQPKSRPNPTYRVRICKLVSDPKKDCKWKADGVGESLLEACHEADMKAQHQLRSDPD